LKSKRTSNVLGPKIRRLRERAEPKITQEDMAGRLAKYGIQLNQPQIAKIESGNRPLRDYELIAIAKALRVPIQDLFH
jgi:transcriptional regulator with XRE-family HTH domain